MKRSQSHKMFNDFLKTSATVAVLGLSTLGHVAQAEEVEAVQPVEGNETTTTATPEVKQEVTLAEVQASQAVAQADVDSARAVVESAETAVAQAEAQVSQSQQNVDVANEAVVGAKEELATAQAIAAEATPEAIETTQTAVTEKAEALTAAKAQTIEAETNVAEQAKIVDAAQAEVDKAQEKVDNLTALVESPDKVKADKAIVEAEISTLETSIISLDQQIVTATEEAKVQAADELKKKQAELAAKQAELATLEADHGKTETVTVENNIDTSAIMGGNAFVISSFPTAIINKANTQGYASLTQSEKTSFLNQTKAYDTSNQYKSIAKDSYNIDLDNLTTAQQNEIAIFASNLINDVRTHIGLSELEVVAGAQEFADRLTRRYKQVHNGQSPVSFGYHDLALIGEAASAVGLRPVETYYYEALGNGQNRPATMDQLKSTVYNTLKYFLFNDSYPAMPLGHTVNLLRTSTSGKVYLGADTTSVGNYTVHFMVVDANNVVDASKFDTTSVSKSTSTTTTTVDRSAEIATAKAQVANLTTAITNLNQVQNNPASSATVVSLTNQLQEKKSALTTAQSKLATLTEQVKQLESNQADLQEQLTVATTALTAARSTLTKEQEILESLTEEAATASAVVAGLEKELAALEAKLALYTNPNLVSDAEAKLEAALLEQATAESALAEGLSKLESLRAELALAQTDLEEKLAVLAEVTALVESLLPAEEVSEKAIVPVTVSGQKHKQKLAKLPKAVEASKTPKVPAFKAPKAKVRRTPKRSTAKALPNTGDATGLLALAGVAMTNFGLVGLKRRQK